jgi:iron-sulfur cluster repair protein YtfE (RIC family)
VQSSIAGSQLTRFIPERTTELPPAHHLPFCCDCKINFAAAASRGGMRLRKIQEFAGLSQIETF